MTGWMMIFAYALYVPAGISLTSAYAAQLVADTAHVTVASWVLFLVILGAVVLVAYLGIGASSAVDLVLVAGEVAVIAALAVTVLVRVGPAHYSAAVLSPASSPHGQLTDITNAMIYGITAFAGYEAAAALGEEARSSRRAIPAATIGVVIVTGAFYLLVVLRRDVRPRAAVRLHRGRAARWAGSPASSGRRPRCGPSISWSCSPASASSSPRSTRPSGCCSPWAASGPCPAALARLSSRRTPVVAIGCVAGLALALGLPLTYAYGGVSAFGYLAGAGGLSVVLVYLAVNIAAIRAFRTEFRDEFRLGRHLLVPATAAVLLLFPLWGILHPRAQRTGRPAAVRRARLARPRGGRRQRPPGPAARPPRDAGPGIHAASR